MVLQSNGDGAVVVECIDVASGRHGGLLSDIRIVVPGVVVTEDSQPRSC
ncbi:MAG: hypothetical protein V3W34_20295 [Phycisphaerae bacterium]